VIVSIDIAPLGLRQGPRALAKRPQPEQVEGLRYAETVFTAPLGARLLPRPDFGTVALIAAWDDDAARDRFDRHPLGRAFSTGWQARMTPLRVSGAWPQMPGLPERQLPVDDDEPVAVLTLGRLKPWRLRPFLSAAAPAEADAVDAPGLLATTGFGRPPLVSTFSVWRTAAAMRDYAYRQGGSHRAAVAADRSRPFHRASAFIRFRPYAVRGACGEFGPLPA
jgi:heme-degrading monooxygenase HmoA